MISIISIQSIDRLLNYFFETKRKQSAFIEHLHSAHYLHTSTRFNEDRKKTREEEIVLFYLKIIVDFLERSLRILCCIKSSCNANAKCVRMFLFHFFIFHSFYCLWLALIENLTCMLTNRMNELLAIVDQTLIHLNAFIFFLS